MPIRAELRHLYRGPMWRGVRAKILKRAKHCCEQCGKPDRSTVYTYTRPGESPRMAWVAVDGDPVWTNQDRDILPKSQWPAPGLPRKVRVVLTVAHLDHEPTNNAPENLKALCTWCHLNYDKLHHKETRSIRKDAARPLLREIAG